MRRVLPLFVAVFFSACVTVAPQRLVGPEVDAAILGAIEQKRIPGGVLWVERDGKSDHRAYGNRALEPAIEMVTEDTIYDAASLTKVMNDATTREQFERQGAEPMTSTPEEMLKLINAEWGRFGQAIKLAGLTVQ